MKLRIFLPSFFLVLVSACVSLGQKAGLASQYPGDVGIEKDPDVLLVENFESSLQEVVSRWSDVKNVAGISLLADVPKSSAGTRSARLTCVGGENTGAHFFKCVPEWENEPILYLRYYVKYVDSASRYHHAGGRLGGYHPAVPYPIGGAGIRPDGTDKFTVSLEPFQKSDPHRHQFYNYWVGMKPGGDGRYYGNVLLMEDPAASAVVYDEWMAVEIMVKLNTPGQKDGEIAAWINGKKVAHYRPGAPLGRGSATFTPGAGQDPFPGIDFRTEPVLALNFIKLEMYSSATPAGATSHIMYDDVVVARRYIGPIQRR